MNDHDHDHHDDHCDHDHDQCDHHDDHCDHDDEADDCVSRLIFSVALRPPRAQHDSSLPHTTHEHNQYNQYRCDKTDRCDNCNTGTQSIQSIQVWHRQTGVITLTHTHTHTINTINTGVTRTDRCDNCNTRTHQHNQYRCDKDRQVWYYVDWDQRATTKPGHQLSTTDTCSMRSNMTSSSKSPEQVVCCIHPRCTGTWVMLYQRTMPAFHRSSQPLPQHNTPL